MVDWAELTLLIYVIARMSGFVLFNPLFGRSSIPGIFRAGVVFVLAISVLSSTQQSVVIPAGILQLAFRILLEMSLGLLLGAVINFFLYIPQLAGEVIDMQLGMTMNQVYDPGSQANLSMNGVLLNTLMMMLFFAANGHHTLLRIFLTSGEIVPYGAAALGNAAANAMLELFIQCTLFAVKLCLPILAAELVGQIGMGILMKVIPQINVFAINIELKVIIGMTLMFLLISPISEYLLEIEMNMLNSLEEILRLTAG